MNVNLENDEDFAAALEEVEALLETAREFEGRNERKYSAANKSALLLLTAKFENFVESAAADYIAKINQVRPSPRLIPEVLRMQHTFKALSNLESLKSKHKHLQAVSTFTNLGILWRADDSTFIDLVIDCKFNYGKHGEKEFKKLFEIIGIDDVFEKVRVFKEQESLIENVDRVEVDFKGTFNSITSMRNNIIHQDASPTLNTDTIYGYKEEFKSFAKELIILLNRNLTELVTACSVSISGAIDTTA